MAIKIIDGDGSEVYLQSTGSGSEASPYVLTTTAGASSGVTTIGGTTVAVSGSVTRPADTTAYAAGDALSNSTSAPTVITFANSARTAAGSGVILDALLVDSANQATKGSFELWLFDTTATPDNDNAAFTPTDAELATLVGVFVFDTAYVGDATSGAGGNAVYLATNVRNRPFKCPSGTSLFGLVAVRNAYTPVSAEALTFRLSIVQD